MKFSANLNLKGHQFFYSPCISKCEFCGTKDNFSSEVNEDKADRICFCATIAYACLMILLVSILMSHTSLHVSFFYCFGLCLCR